MALTLAASPASARCGETITVTIAGASNSTAYIVDVGTTKVHKYEVTTDGSGAGTIKHTASGSAGSMTFSIRPKTEWTGTTTAAATCTANQTAG